MVEKIQKFQEIKKSYKNERLQELDLAKGVGIILVVAGHSTYVAEDVLTWLTSFHMPLFFLLSGMLFYHTKAEKTHWKAFLAKKYCQIMIPYFFFSLIYIAVDYYYLFSHPELMSQEHINYAFLQAISFFGISVLWFLPTLFGSEVLLHWLMRMSPTWGIVLLAVSFFVFPELGMEGLRRSIRMEDGYLQTWAGYLIMALLRVFPATAFMVIGYYFQYWIQRLRFAAPASDSKKDNYKKQDKNRNKGKNRQQESGSEEYRPGNALVEILIGVILLVFNVAAAFSNGRVDMHYLVFNHVPTFVLAACSASLGLVLILRHVKNIWLLSFLGANSLIIMLTHLDCQVMSLGIRFATGIQKRAPFGGGILFYFALYGFLLFAELALIVLINRYFYFLLGRRNPVKMTLPKFLRLKRWRFKIIK